MVMLWYIYIILIDINRFKKKLTVAFCKILMTLQNCNTKDRMDTSNFGQIWRRFMMDIIDIMVCDETGDKIEQKTLDFDTIKYIYEIEKLNLNLMDYPCTPIKIQNRKINEKLGYFKNMA